MPAMQLRVKLPVEPVEPAETETVRSPEPRPGLFRRILHHLRSPPSSPALPDADAAPQHRQDRGERPRRPRPKASFRRLRSKPDSPDESEAEPPNRVLTFEAYVPRHAAADFSRTACSRDGGARFHSFDEDRRRAVLEAAPPTERPGTSPGLPLAPSPPSPDQAPPPSRPAGGAPARQPLSVVGLGADGRPCRIAPLPLPPLPAAKRHVPRHSYKLASDPFEAPPELSDYEKFIQKAVEEDRQHREALWRTLSQRSARGRGDGAAPRHPDLSLHPHQQQHQPVETSRRERRGSTGGKRSILSYRSHADRQEKREPAPPKQVGKRTSNRSLRKLHDYFVPRAAAV